MCILKYMLYISHIKGFKKITVFAIYPIIILLSMQIRGKTQHYKEKNQSTRTAPKITQHR